MRSGRGAVVLAALLGGACTPPALVVQRDAQRIFWGARGVELSATGYAKKKAALCREEAVEVETAARSGYPGVTETTRAAHRRLLVDCGAYEGSAPDGGMGR